MPSISVMIYLRSPSKMNFRTPGHFRPDFLTVFYILTIISFLFPCIFLKLRSPDKHVLRTPVNVFKEKINSEHPDKLPGVRDTLYVMSLSQKKKEKVTLDFGLKLFLIGRKTSYYKQLFKLL